VGKFSSGPGRVVGEIVSRHSGSPHYPGLHLLIYGSDKPYREANRVGFGFRSRATQERPNGNKIRPQIVDLWIIENIRLQTKKYLFPLESPKILESRN
jgi:hypothetical protein